MKCWANINWAFKVGGKKERYIACASRFGQSAAYGIIIVFMAVWTLQVMGMLLLDALLGDLPELDYRNRFRLEKVF